MLTQANDNKEPSQINATNFTADEFMALKYREHTGLYREELLILLPKLNPQVGHNPGLFAEAIQNLILAKHHNQNGKYDESLKLINETEKFIKIDASSLELKGWILLHNQKIDTAKTAYYRALEVATYFPFKSKEFNVTIILLSHYYLYHIYLIENNFASAQHHLQELFIQDLCLWNKSGNQSLLSEEKAQHIIANKTKLLGKNLPLSYTPALTNKTSSSNQNTEIELDPTASKDFLFNKMFQYSFTLWETYRKNQNLSSKTHSAIHFKRRAIATQLERWAVVLIDSYFLARCFSPNISFDHAVEEAAKHIILIAELLPPTKQIDLYEAALDIIELETFKEQLSKAYDALKNHSTEKTTSSPSPTPIATEEKPLQKPSLYQLYEITPELNALIQSKKNTASSLSEPEEIAHADQFAKKGENKKAIKIFDKLIQNNPTGVFLYLKRGVLLEKSDKSRQTLIEAVASLSHGIMLNHSQTAGESAYYLKEYHQLRHALALKLEIWHMVFIDFYCLSRIKPGITDTKQALTKSLIHLDKLIKSLAYEKQISIYEKLASAFPSEAFVLKIADINERIAQYKEEKIKEQQQKAEEHRLKEEKIAQEKKHAEELAAEKEKQMLAEAAAKEKAEQDKRARKKAKEDKKSKNAIKPAQPMKISDDLPPIEKLIFEKLAPCNPKFICLTGGSVRDEKLEIKGNDGDLDYRTSLTSIKIANQLEALKLTSTIRFMTNESIYLTYQGCDIDIYCCDNLLSSFKEFCINGWVKYQNGVIKDITGKAQHAMENKLINTFDSADTVIPSNPILIMRAIYLKHKLQFTIEETLDAAMKSHLNSLSNCATHEMNSQLNKIEHSPHKQAILNEIIERGIFKTLFPQLCVHSNDKEIAEAFCSDKENEPILTGFVKLIIQNTIDKQQHDAVLLLHDSPNKRQQINTILKNALIAAEQIIIQNKFLRFRYGNLKLKNQFADALKANNNYKLLATLLSLPVTAAQVDTQNQQQPKPTTPIQYNSAAQVNALLMQRPPTPQPFPQQQAIPFYAMQPYPYYAPQSPMMSNVSHTFINNWNNNSNNHASSPTQIENKPHSQKPPLRKLPPL